MIISNSQGVWLGFSLRSTPSTFVGNVGIYSVGTESVYQIAQSNKTECFVGVLREGLARELLAKYNCLHLY